MALLTPILHGQTHGGIAQGVGQALLENSYYEPQSGQLLAASFMDYVMPRADTLPINPSWGGPSVNKSQAYRSSRPIPGTRGATTW